MSFPIAPGRRTNKVIILDIDHTLVSSMLDKQLQIFLSLSLQEQGTHRVLDLTMKRDEGDEDDDGYETQLKSICRPHLHSFLTWCNWYFSHVIFWTAGTRSYAEAVVSALYDDRIYPRPLVYARKECLPVDNTYRKPIEMLIARFSLEKFMDMHNCVIVDDTPTTYKYNPDNAIPIPPFLREDFSVETLRQSDECLLHIKAWFETEHVLKSTNLASLSDKATIFNKALHEIR
jgi:TFIIF-interacting CTD phosphatase-like protein